MRRKDPVKCSRFWIHSCSNSVMDHIFVSDLVLRIRDNSCFKALAFIPSKLLCWSPCFAVCLIQYFYPVTSPHQFLELKVRWPVPAPCSFTDEPCTVSHICPKLFWHHWDSPEPQAHTFPGREQPDTPELQIQGSAEPLWAMGGFGSLSSPQLHLILAILLGRFYVFTTISE